MPARRSRLPLLCSALLAALSACCASAARAQEDDCEEDARALRVLRGGEPAAGVRVRAWRRGLEGGRPQGEWVSDAQGWVEPTGVQPGGLTFQVVGGGPAALRRSLGELDLRGSVPLRGTVRGPGGEPLAGAEVALGLGALELARTRSGDDGGFRLDWWQVDGAVLVVSAPGCAPVRWAVGPGTCAVQLRAGEAGALRGRVLGRDGLALPGALVRAIRGERTPATTATDGLGWFAFPTLEAGVVTLEVLGPQDGAPLLRADARVLADDAAEVQLRVPEPASLTVLVRERDAPVPGCPVQLIDPGVTRFGGYSESAVQPERPTDDDGLARFTGLPPGRYFLRSYPGGRAAPLLNEVDLRPGAGQRVIQEAVRERELRVKVVDQAGNPLPGVFMDVSLPGINWHAMPSSRTGPDGVGRFFDLPEGRAEVHLGRGELWRMVVSAGEEATFVWTEARPLRLHGTLVGAQGKVLVAAVLPDVVHMTPLELGPGGALDAQVVPPAGDLRVFLLAADRRLAPLDLGRVEGARLEAGRLTFPRGARVTGRLVDRERGGGVAGRVRPEGALGGVLEAQVQWLGGTDHDPWITVNEWTQATGPDGLFQLDGLPAGPLRLVVHALGAVERTLEVSLEVGVTLDLGEIPVDPR